MVLVAPLLLSAWHSKHVAFSEHDGVDAYFFLFQLKQVHLKPALQKLKLVQQRKRLLRLMQKLLQQAWSLF